MATMQNLQERPSPFVLVHGGRHGGWCWRDVASGLRAAGHDVYTPTLTGLGERAHLLHPDIGLATHVQDLVGVLEWEDLMDVVVVAHSYAGMVVCGAMETIAPRVRRLVFIDAHMPRTGESMFDMIGEPAAAQRIALANEVGQGWFIPPTDASYWGVEDSDDIAWVNSKTTAQPLKTYEERVGRTDKAWAHPGTFIECQPSGLPDHVLDRPRQRSGVDTRFHHRVLRAPHDAMVTAPDALTTMLIEAIDD
jgi:pimeloyl-ACP methyl ester carboxylesterase